MKNFLLLPLLCFSCLSKIAIGFRTQSFIYIVLVFLCVGMYVLILAFMGCPGSDPYLGRYR